MLTFGFLVIALLIGGWSSFPRDGGGFFSTSVNVPMEADASDPELVINNQTGAVFYVTLTGPASYTVQVAAGKNTIVVVKGEYTLSFYACNAQQTRTVNVKKNGASIKLTCDVPKTGKTPKLTIDNKAAPMYVTFTGTKTYSLYATTGKTDFEVEPGTYEVSYFACGAQTTVEFVVKKKGGTFKISCLDVTFFNLNDSSIVGLELSGPADYYFSLPPGKKSFQMVPGTYDYELSGPCSAVGTVKITKKITLYVYCFSD